MMRSANIFLLALGAFCGVCSSMEAAEPPESSVVFVEVGYMENAVFVKVEEGTGFIVHPSGWVVTAKHVVEAPLPAGKIRFLRGAAKSNTATPNPMFEAAVPVVSADIALLRFSPNLRSDWPSLKIKANYSFKRLDKVTAYGFPNGHDLEARPGVVSSLIGPSGSTSAWRPA
jgi:S1-C subfamily serine protease